jgi:hypothetical protein
MARHVLGIEGQHVDLAAGTDRDVTGRAPHVFHVAAGENHVGAVLGHDAREGPRHDAREGPRHRRGGPEHQPGLPLFFAPGHPAIP